MGEIPLGLSGEDITMRAEKSPLWFPHEREIPAVAHVLQRADERLAPGASIILVVASGAYDHAYNRWEAVRLWRAGEVTGSIGDVSGGEGYYKGTLLQPAQIIVHQAKLAQDQIDTDVRWHRHDPTRRSKLMKFIRGDQISDLTVVDIARNIFLSVRGQMRGLREQMTPRGIQENDTFRRETENIAAKMPDPVKVFKDNGKFINRSYLPEAAQTTNSAKILSAAPSGYGDGYELIQRLGIMGYGVFRVLEACPKTNRIITADRAFYAPRGTPKRTRLDDLILRDFITEMSRFFDGIPGNIEDPRAWIKETAELLQAESPK